MRKQVQRISALVVLGAAVASAHAAVPYGSFIKKPVKNVAELVKHVRSDEEVMDRYERHFRLKPNQVVSYFNSLHLAKLTRTGSYTVYNVHPDGVIRARVFQLKAGTLVFADANNRPIMRQVCGNPMVMEIPPMGSEPGVATSSDVRENDYQSSSVETVTMAEPSVMPVPDVPVSPGPPVAPPTAVGVTRSNNGIGALALLGIIPFLIHDGGHEQPVPEPASMVVLAAGAGYIMKRRKKS